MPHVNVSSLGLEIWTTEIKVHDIFVTSSRIPFGPLYPTLQQFSPGVLFRDEFWERLEP